MEEEQRAEKREPPRGGSRRSTAIRYSPDQKLKAVRLVLEGRFSRGLVSQEIGACKSSLAAWIDKYRVQGEAGLRAPRAAPARQDKLTGAVTEQIVSLKQAHPTIGVKKIAQVLRQLFWLRAGAETARHPRSVGTEGWPIQSSLGKMSYPSRMPKQEAAAGCPAAA